MPVVGERFQVVIERQARERLGIRPGDRAVEVVEGDRLVVTFLPARHRRSLRGRLSGEGRLTDYGRFRDGPTLPDALADEHRAPG